MSAKGPFRSRNMRIGIHMISVQEPSVCICLSVFIAKEYKNHLSSGGLD